MTEAPLILWFRRDLRLDDHPMLTAAAATGRPLIPVAILDPETEALGAAPKWRWGLGVQAFAAALAARGLPLVLRRGPAVQVLLQLVAETGAAAVHWSRLYDPAARARDSAVKAALRAAGTGAESHPGHLLHEPWTVQTLQGACYRVYTPFWRAISARPAPDPLPPPAALRPAGAVPAGDRLADWRLGAAMNRGAAVVRPHLAVGEAAAQDRLAAFLARGIETYAEARDRPDLPGTSRLSENLALGEIGPRRLWAAAQAAMLAGARGAETWARELVWREFAWHLLYHTPHLAERNWKPDWDGFPWAGDSDLAERWRRGMTGLPFVDAAMREMHVTGTMHNRGRMIVASYLTRHLLTHWKIGLDWFADCLADWDPAANALGWQWVAGSGPDAAPYFRIINPETQAEKFDPEGRYRRRFVAELSARPGDQALAFFDAVPRSWGLDPAAPYPRPAVDPARGRARALAAWGARKS